MQDETINLEDYTKSDWAIMLNDRVITRFTTHADAKLIIGHSPDADVIINNNDISAHHSSLELRDGRHYLADLKSTNGTTVNGKKIVSKVPVTEKDLIFIGEFRLTQTTADELHTSSANAAVIEIDEETDFFVSSPLQEITAQASQTPAPFANEVYSLTVIEGDASPSILSLDEKSRAKIGKDPSCDIIIPGLLVGNTQCYVMNKKGKYYLVPQRSWTNTKLNDFTIKEERLLRKGDIIQIKQVKIRFN